MRSHSMVGILSTLSQPKWLVCIIITQISDRSKNSHEKMHCIKVITKYFQRQVQIILFL